MSQDWGYFLIEFSLREALEEITTRVFEEAWLNNEYAFNISFDYIHCFNLCSLIRISKIIPSFFVDKASCTRQFESELSLHSLASLFPIKEEVFSTSPSLLQGELHFLPKPLFLRKRGCNRPTRCSEPLRSKVGGPSKVYAILCGMGPRRAIDSCEEELHHSVLSC